MESISLSSLISSLYIYTGVSFLNFTVVRPKSIGLERSFSGFTKVCPILRISLVSMPWFLRIDMVVDLRPFKKLKLSFSPLKYFITSLFIPRISPGFICCQNFSSLASLPQAIAAALKAPMDVPTIPDILIWQSLKA